MRRKIRYLLGITAASLLCSSTLHSELIHRYTFDVDASDSVGNAHGTLEGAYIFEGGVVLESALATYVNLPGGLIDGASAVSIESWASFGDNANWARLFDFGDTNPDTGNGRDYIFFTPHSQPLDNRLGIADGDPGYTSENNAIAPGILDNQGLVHIVCVFEPENDSLRIYLNGELAGYRNGPTIPLSNITNVYSYIGRSLYNADPYVNATVDEFRVYNHAITAYEAAQNFAAGMDNYTPVTTPAPDSISVVMDEALYVGNTRAVTVTAAYGGDVLNITGEPGVTLASSDPAIISINEAGQLVANALGSTEITASFQGVTSVTELRVEPVPVPEASLKHRYSFNEPISEFIAIDSVSGANGDLYGFASFTGEGEVDLVSVGDPFSDGYVNLPNGIISALTNATYEMWVTFDAEPGNWQRIFDFGSSDAGEDLQGVGTAYTFFSPRTGGAGPWRFEVKTPETPAYFWEGPSTLPSGAETHVAITYNTVANVSKVYINGRLLAEGTAPIALSDINDVNNWLGRSQFMDAGFDGKFDEFRIYEGVLTDLQVMISRAAGPNSQIDDPGALQSLSLNLDSDQLVFGGLSGNFSVVADFEQIQDVEITSLPELTVTSSDTNIVAITSSGVITPAAQGTAVLTARLNGQETTAEVTVNPQPDAPLQLLHRYSFNEPASSFAAEDSAGDADGFLFGNAAFTGDGQLSLPGGPASSTDAGYVDLPNGMISALPDAVTIESWVTWNGGPVWQRIWDFGNNLAGEDMQGTGDSTFFLTPQAGGANVVRAAFRPVSTAPETPVLDGGAPLPVGAEAHVAVVYDYTSGVSRLYVDGVRVDAGPVTDPLSAMTDINNWFGRSNWPDEYFNGLLNEIRFWSGAMSDQQVAARFAAGPDSLEEPPAQPELAVTREEGALAISWPAAATGFELEQTTALGPDAQWTTVTEPVQTEGGLNTVTIQPAGEAQFFRLAQ